LGFEEYNVYRNFVAPIFMDTSKKCGAAIWGKGSIANPPIGHCVLPRGHNGKCMILVETTGSEAVQEELDLEPDPTDVWKPGRDIPEY
jgi:hypothetical protein